MLLLSPPEGQEAPEGHAGVCFVYLRSLLDDLLLYLVRNALAT